METLPLFVLYVLLRIKMHLKREKWVRLGRSDTKSGEKWDRSGCLGLRKKAPDSVVAVPDVPRQVQTRPEKVVPVNPHPDGPMDFPPPDGGWVVENPPPP